MKITQAMIFAILNPAKAMTKLLRFDNLRTDGKADEVDASVEDELLKGLDEVARVTPGFKSPLAYFKKTLRKFGGNGE